jgi:hypothetical protein
MPKVVFELAKAYENAVTEDFKEEDMSVSIRQIKNGWIVSRSWKERKPDDDYEYKNEEEFYSENPIPVKS